MISLDTSAGIHVLAPLFDFCAPLVEHLLPALLLFLLLLRGEHLLPFEALGRLPSQVCCPFLGCLPLIFLELRHRDARALRRRLALPLLGLALGQDPLALLRRGVIFPLPLLLVTAQSRRTGRTRRRTHTHN
jgi:hypothetical protein